MAISNSGYYIYAAKPSWSLVPGRYLRIYIQMGGSLGSLKERYKKYSKVSLQRYYLLIGSVQTALYRQQRREY